MPMPTKTKNWKKKWFGDVIKSNESNKHPIYKYDTLEPFFINGDQTLNKLSKVSVKQLLDDPNFTYLMLPFIGHVDYYHWTREELEVRKNEIFSCECCEDKSVLEYMDLGDLFSMCGKNRKVFSKDEFLHLSTGVLIHTK